MKQVFGRALIVAAWTAFIVVILASFPRAQFDAVPGVYRAVPHWSLVNDPAANTAATATRAASSTGGLHVADCVTATFIANTTAPTAVNVTAVIRDGATGAGTIVWAADLALQATISDRAAPIQLCGLNIPGTANTAMTVEFTAAGGANTFETVALTGYDKAP